MKTEMEGRARDGATLVGVHAVPVVHPWTMAIVRGGMNAELGSGSRNGVASVRHTRSPEQEEGRDRTITSFWSGVSRSGRDMMSRVKKRLPLSPPFPWFLPSSLAPQPPPPAIDIAIAGNLCLGHSSTWPAQSQ